MDLIDVWPPPNSMLVPIYEDDADKAGHFVFKLTFSRPVFFNKSYVSLSLSTTINLLALHPYYSQSSYGSRKSLWVYFRVMNSVKYIQ